MGNVCSKKKVGASSGFHDKVQEATLRRLVSRTGTSRRGWDKEAH